MFIGQRHCSGHGSVGSADLHAVDVRSQNLVSMVQEDADLHLRAAEGHRCWTSAVDLAVVSAWLMKEHFHMTTRAATPNDGGPRRRQHKRWCPAVVDAEAAVSPPSQYLTVSPGPKSYDPLLHLVTAHLRGHASAVSEPTIQLGAEGSCSGGLFPQSSSIPASRCLSSPRSSRSFSNASIRSLRCGS